MPEPHKEDLADDPYSIDTNDGFNIKDEHVSSVRKVAFIVTPVLVGYTFGWGFTGHWNHTDQMSTRNWCAEMAVLMTDFKHGANIGLLTPLYVIWGGVPQSFTSRLVGMNWSLCVVSWPMMYVLRPANDYKRNHFHLNQQTDVGIDAILQFWCCGLAWFIAYSMMITRSYSVRHGWGVYCCASFPRGIVFRLSFMCSMMVWTDWYVSSFLFAYGRLDIPGKEAVPLLIFGWKRFKYVTKLLLSTDDCPWKMWSLFPNTLYVMLQLNANVAQAMVGVQDISQMVFFIIVDALQFIARSVLLARTGMKQCPKLFSFVLEKQLQNVVVPLPKLAAASGDKTAMRIMQALMVLLEGETLTSNLCFLALYFLNWGTLLQDNYAWITVPLKSAWVVGVFFLIDLIQDLIAARVTDKFSNWTYIYAAEGWSHKRHRWQSWCMYHLWTTHSLAVGGYLVKNASLWEHKAISLPIYLYWHPSPAAYIHI